MSVLDQLARYLPQDPEEAEHKRRMLEFVARRPEPFDRRNREAHLTASGLVFAASAEAVLLLHHRKLGCWVQPGGHADPGEACGEVVAVREAQEETGIPGLVLHPTAPRPIHIEILTSPAVGEEPAHEHLDLRYLLLAPASIRLVPSGPESSAIRWFGWAELPSLDLDAGLARALCRARRYASPR